MAPAIENILVPTDFSNTSNNALKAAIDICKKKKATLHLLHVIETQYVVAVAPEPGISAAVMATDMQQEARSQLYNIYERVLAEHEIKVHTHLAAGVAYEEICKTGNAVAANLIIMGNKGTHGLKELLNRSTAFNVIKHSSLPVLTIPGHITAFKFDKILFPARPVNELREKYNFLKPFISRKSSFHIAAMCSLGELEELAAHRNELHEIISSLKKLGVTYTTEMYTCNNVATKVLELAELFGADLIAINATLDYKWKNFFVGPYTQQIVNHSSVPVLSFPNG